MIKRIISGDKRVKDFITKLIKEYNVQRNNLFITLKKKLYHKNSRSKPHQSLPSVASHKTPRYYPFTTSPWKSLHHGPLNAPQHPFRKPFQTSRQCVLSMNHRIIRVNMKCEKNGRYPMLSLFWINRPGRAGIINTEDSQMSRLHFEFHHTCQYFFR